MPIDSRPTALHVEYYMDVHQNHFSGWIIISSKVDLTLGWISTLFAILDIAVLTV